MKELNSKPFTQWMWYTGFKPCKASVIKLIQHFPSTNGFRYKLMNVFLHQMDATEDFNNKFMTRKKIFPLSEFICNELTLCFADERSMLSAMKNLCFQQVIVMEGGLSLIERANHVLFNQVRLPSQVKYNVSLHRMEITRGFHYKSMRSLRPMEGTWASDHK